jgi:hypothetical protein
MEGGTVANVMGWGRWIGAANIPTSEIFGPNEGYHYVVGLPTATMPTNVVGTVAFTLIGATNPTGSDGTIAPGMLGSGSMSVLFGQGAVAVTLNPSFATWGYTTTMNGGFSGGPFMTGSGTGFETGGVAPSAYACSSCTTSFEGAFFGAGASHAGIAYQFSTGPAGTTAKVSGVAVFQQ